MLGVLKVTSSSVLTTILLHILVYWTSKVDRWTATTRKLVGRARIHSPNWVVSLLGARNEAKYHLLVSFELCQISVQKKCMQPSSLLLFQRVTTDAV